MTHREPIRPQTGVSDESVEVDDKEKVVLGMGNAEASEVGDDDEDPEMHGDPIDETEIVGE